MARATRLLAVLGLAAADGRRGRRRALRAARARVDGEPLRLRGARARDDSCTRAMAMAAGRARRATRRRARRPARTARRPTIRRRAARRPGRGHYSQADNGYSDYMPRARKTRRAPARRGRRRPAGAPAPPGGVAGIGAVFHDRKTRAARAAAALPLRKLTFTTYAYTQISTSADEL